MCFTGNFALTMMLEPAVLAPVLSQPSLPLNDPAGLEISPEDIKEVRTRLDREDLTVLAYRFEGDRFCRAERFATYVAALGDRFVGRVLPHSAANTEVAPFFAARVRCPHSVVTQHLIDEAGPRRAVRRPSLGSRVLGRGCDQREGSEPVVAALRHDAIEDQDVERDEIAKRFGDDVASLVQEVTDDKSRNASASK
jgi:hypothetical protein